MNSLPQGSRITFRQAKPNPLFQCWIEELLKEAVEKKSNNESALKKALNSLTKYPLPLQCGTECAILKGFSKNLCTYLDKQLEAYNLQKDLFTNNSPPRSSDSDSDTYDLDLPKVDLPGTSNSNSFGSVDQDNVAQGNAVPSTSKPKTPKKKQSRPYKPAFRSGGYALLVGLLENLRERPDHPALLKEELVDIAQKHCEESLTRPKSDSFYTAWSSMPKLISKGLVISRRKGRKKEYFLTDAGIEKAQEVLKDYADRPTNNDIIFNGASPHKNRPSLQANTELDRPISREITETQVPVPLPQIFEAIEMPPGSFDVILLIDVCETSGLSKRHDQTVTQFKKYPDLKHEYRSLKIGDYTWVARHKSHKDQELVLPYIVERKRMDDLGSSIKDGRFHEQKFRLRKSGIKNVIYLVENYGSIDT